MKSKPVLHIKRCVLALCVLWLQASAVQGQGTTISGLLRNRAGKPVAGISVLLKKQAGMVVAFGESDKDGTFRISLPDSIDRTSVVLEINWLGYKKIEQPLKENINQYPLTLEEKVIELKEIMVKSRSPLIQRSDTLRYNVNAFSQQEDRSIGDVIKHLPGMTVDHDGQISFNGKPIANLYIHDDDLMDGRYGLATRTINKGMIKSIDVMLNHQSIRVLQNKLPSDAVVVNLVLKDENSLKLSGQAALGAGIPGLYETELNGMVLNKTFKMLNSLKANNSGVDYRSDFIQYRQQDFLSSVDNTRPAPLLSDGTAGDPGIPRRNFYRNQSLALNLNNLYNTKDTLQLRLNMQLFFDRNVAQYNSRADYFLPSDTARYTTFQDMQRRPFQWSTALTASANKRRYLLNETVRFNLGGYTNSSNLDFNNIRFPQQLYARTYELSNELEYTPAMRDNVANLHWYFGFYNAPQRLFIGSGLDSTVLNGGNAYRSVEQKAAIPSWFSHLSMSYLVIGKHWLRQRYQLGMLNEWQQLQSSLWLTQLDQTVVPYKGDQGNDLSWRRNKLYAEGIFSMYKKDWGIDVTVPLAWQQARYFETGYQLDANQKRFLVNPSVNFKRFLNTEDYINLNYQYKNSIGNIAGVYRGLILSSYLSLVANDADLQERNSGRIALGYTFKRTPAMLFINASADHTVSTANFIVSSIYANDVQRTILLPMENRQASTSINAGISKYVFAVRTKFAVNASWRKDRYNQLVNGQLYPYDNETRSLNFNVQTRFMQIVTFDYTGSGTWNVSSPANTKGNGVVNRFQRYDQRAALGITPKGGWVFNVSAAHMYALREAVNNINSFFMDASLRYRIKPWRLDAEVALTNLFNVQAYTTAMVSSNQYLYSSYQLRGRMALCKLTFNL